MTTRVEVFSSSFFLNLESWRLAPIMPDPDAPMVTKAELVAAAGRGERIHTEHSLHRAEDQTACAPGFSHRAWRVIACDNHHDVVECSRCGVQRVTACDFDEEFS
jgi:hypothetical protein